MGIADIYDVQTGTVMIKDNLKLFLDIKSKCNGKTCERR